MIKLERPSAIVLRYNWKLTNIKKDVTILSKKIMYQENDSFRIGLKNSSASITLFFLTINLNKIGLTAACVGYSSSSDTKIKEIELKDSRKEDENGAIQLFTASLRPALFGDTCSFIFTVYITGIVENYRVSSMDRLLSRLWIVRFSDHRQRWNYHPSSQVDDGSPKPYFLALFSNREVEPSYVMDCITIDELKQFVKFIYTGVFEKPCSGEVTRRLASKYQVKTMKYINQAALEDNSVDKVTTLAFHFLSGNLPKCTLQISK